jgi:ribonuclease BN (tRNA processing enzyme)
VEHSEPWPDPGLTQFVRNADLMIFDGMFSEAEYPNCRGWGHSTWQKGVELAQKAGVKMLAIFHLYPGHDDDFLRDLECELKAMMPTAFIARERQSIALAPAEGGTLADQPKAVKVPAV